MNIDSADCAVPAKHSAFDVRLIAPDQRHALILRHFEGLPVGAWFELHSDHEPVPLRQQFESLWPGQVDWEVLEAGPAQWRLRIGRRLVAQSCCGCCSGAR